MTIPVVTSAVLTGIFVLNGVAFWLYPILKGADALFGVPVSEEYFRGEQARRRVLGFRVLVVVCTAVTISGSWLLHLGQWGMVVVTAGVLGIVAGLATGHAATRPHRVTASVQAAAVLQPRSRWLYVRPGLEALALLIVLGGMAYLASLYAWAPLGLGEAPARHQRVLRVGQMFTLMQVEVLIAGLFVLMGMAQARVSLPVPPSERYLELRDRYMRLMAETIYLVKLVLIACFAITMAMGIWGALHEREAAIAVGVLGPLVGGNLVMFGGMLLHYWPRMGRLRAQMQELVGPGSLERSADADGWVAGFMYYCPENPSVWVETRMGYGYTLNFARAEAWVVLTALLLPLACLLMAVQH